MWLGPPWAHRDPGWFRAATRKERPCLAQNVAPTLLGTHEHSRVHFSILRLRTQFRAATRKERPCFAAECGFGRLGHTGILEALEQAHEKNGPVLFQNVAPTPLGTHEHSRAHFSILRLRTPKQGVPTGLEQPHEKKGGDLEIGTWPRLKCTFMNRISYWKISLNKPYFSRFMEGEADFRAATRKERLCFAAECGLGRLGHTGTPDGLEQPHEKNGPVLLQNVAPTPLGTHEHSSVHFLIPVLAVYVLGLRNIICRSILQVQAYLYTDKHLPVNGCNYVP